MRVHQEKSERTTHKQNKKWKRRNNNHYHEDTRRNKRTLLYANKLDNLEEVDKFVET